MKDIYAHVFLYNHGHWIGIGNIIGWARKILHIFSELLDAFILHICKYILCIFSEWLDAWANFSTGRPWSGLTKQRGRILKVIEEGIFATTQHNLSFCNKTQHNKTNTANTIVKISANFPQGHISHWSPVLETIQEKHETSLE